MKSGDGYRGGGAVRCLGVGLMLALTESACRATPAVKESIEPRASETSVVSPGAGIQQTGSNTFQIGRVEIDKERRTVSLPGRVRLRNEVVEYALVTEEGKGYESLLTTDARPMDIHVACLLLGVNPERSVGESGSPVSFSDTNAVRIDVTWKTNGQTVCLPLESLVLLTAGRPDSAAPNMRVEKWLYNGSQLRTNGFAAQLEGSIVSLIRDPAALVNNPGADRDNDEIHFPNPKLLPPEGTAVRVILHLTEGRVISSRGVETR